MHRSLIIQLFSWAFYSHFARLTYGEQPIIEPDYENLLYGNIWRHTIFSPSESDASDVLNAKKNLRRMILTHFPELGTSEKTLRCISHHVLWYSSSEKSPLLLDSYVQNKKGHKYPVSVPLSLGNIFNFVLRAAKNESIITHVFTISESYKHSFYLYSHIFYQGKDQMLSVNQGTVSSCRCYKENHRYPLALSMLTLSNPTNLYSERSCEESEPSEFICNANRNGLPPFHVTANQPLQTNLVKTDGSATLSIMTYNIWNFNSYQHSSFEEILYEQRFERILQLLGEIQPDIAGFQEVRFQQGLGGKFGPNQAEHLTLALPDYQFVFQPAQVMPDSLQQGRTEEGVAIFSKFPIIHHEYLLLFRNQLNSADQHQRVCLHAVIYVPVIGKIHVFNTHLSLSHEAREESVAQIVEFMKEVGKDEPALLMGDLNATPEEKAIRMLSRSGELVDLWDKLHSSLNGFTFNNLNEKLSKRIDYIFMKKSNKVTAQKMEVIYDKIKSKAASDHRPVVATVSFKT